MILEHFMICQRFGKPVNKNGNFHMMATVALNCYNPSKTIQGNLLSFLGCSVPMSQNVLVLQSSEFSYSVLSLFTHDREHQEACEKNLRSSRPGSALLCLLSSGVYLHCHIARVTQTHVYFEM